jgi:hypothetical protein
MEEVMRLLKSKARPLAVGGTLVSGKALAALTAAYVEAVNQGEWCLLYLPASLCAAATCLCTCRMTACTIAAIMC